MECPTCRKLGEGEYCMHCGEDMRPDRITIRHVFRQFAEIFIGFESNRLLHTFRDLAIRPGSAIRMYLRGTRQSYYNPVDYLMLMGGLSIAISFFLHESLFEGLKAQALQNAENKKFMSYILENLGTLMNLALFLQFPIASLLTWLRRAKGYHLLGEHIYANAFLSGQVFAYNLIFLGLQKIIPASGFLLFLSEVYGYFILGYISFSYYRWRHVNLKFPKIFLSMIFMASVYVFSFVVGFMLSVLYYYIQFRFYG